MHTMKCTRCLAGLLPVGFAVIALAVASEAALANEEAADTTNADQLWTGGGLGLNLTGAGVTVGIWEALEGGTRWEVRDTHEAFTYGQPGGQSRVTFGDATGSGYSSHATHVAGTIGGAHIPDDENTSRNEKSTWGMAPGVTMISLSAGADTSEMVSEFPEVDISNHSYGFRYGGWETRSWDVSDGNGGTVSKTYSTWFYATSTYYRDQFSEDPRYGRYDFYSYDLDNALVQRPKLLSFWSAGNERGYGYSDLQGDDKYVARFSTDYINNVGVIGEDLGNGYFLVHESDYGIPDHDGPNGGGYDSLSGDKNAKNSVVVGATLDHTTDPHSSSGISTTSFSSYGPTDDGSLGVDLVANGNSLDSSINTSDTSYGRKSGTSMSAPNAAGTAALILEHWRNQNGNQTPDSATQKGLLMHTATDATAGSQVGPDYRTGYGLLNAVAAVQHIDEAIITPEASRTDHIIEQTLDEYTEHTLDLLAIGGEFKASLSWLDPASTSSYSSGLDDRTPALINDLDIWVTDGQGNTYLTWVLDPNNPSAAATRNAHNRVDNFTQVLIDSVDALTELTLHIGHFGDLLGTEQDYALFVSGATIVPEPRMIGAALLWMIAYLMRRKRAV